MSTRGYDVRWATTRAGRQAHAIVTLWPRSRVAFTESQYAMLLRTERGFNRCSSSRHLTKTATPQTPRCSGCSWTLEWLDSMLDELRFNWAVEHARAYIERMAAVEAPF